MTGGERTYILSRCHRDIHDSEKNCLFYRDCMVQEESQDVTEKLENRSELLSTLQ